MQNPTMPLRRRVDEVTPERSNGFERQVLFSPSTMGSRYMKLTVVHGEPGARSAPYSLSGDEFTLTLKGCARSTSQEKQYGLPEGTAIVLPAGIEQVIEVTGSEEWVGVIASCDECPLMQQQFAAESSTPTLHNQDHDTRPLVRHGPLARHVNQVAPDSLYGFERRILFSPGTVGTRYMRFAVVHGKPGAKSKPHTHPGGEMALTLEGNARLVANGRQYDLSPGTALAVPPDLQHPAEAIGEDEWVVVTSYCDECPLMKEKKSRDRDPI